MSCFRVRTFRSCRTFKCVGKRSVTIKRRLTSECTVQKELRHAATRWGPAKLPRARL